ncbi:translocation/assembly module TamB domain-containing protein [Geomesophilobacter sediminis]|uniref:Translocation/assembly module TamB domain-containing protein n=1 Tax=Geomesophilobacter sediminis TaxID=2798584 RepID=A0A8J7S920_9BACT|nr:translocation/assembly module TamB domain-containing protein [Geomesophilobacter sediminis]MBJ6728006.1 translocation/assembly module TamB domain-containing protein [Geomesophilobacter sediminis]
MKRLLFALLGAIFLLILVLAGVALWLVGTPDGARFALERLSRLAGVQLQVAEVRGRLWDRLSLRGVTLRLPEQRATVAALELFWNPVDLLGYRLSVRYLALNGVRVQDSAPLTPPSFQLPSVPPFARALRGEIDRLAVTDLVYRQRSEPPTSVTSLTGALSWDGSRLIASRLDLGTPGLRATGDIALGMVQPSLSTDLVLRPAAPVATLDLFQLRAHLRAGRTPEQVAGPLQVTGRSKGAVQVTAAGEIGIAPHSLNLRGVRLAVAGQRGTITGNGSLSYPTRVPHFAVRLEGRDLDLVQQLKVATRLSATLSLTGSGTSYRGELRLANRVPGWQGGTVTSGVRGDAAGVKLAPIRGSVLDGTVSGSLDVGWEDGVRVGGRLSGRGLNPARLAPDWQGVVNLDLAAQLAVPKKGEPRGRLQGRLLESRLHGRELTGTADVAFAGENVVINRALLSGRGFDLTASGELARRLDLAARVSDLSRLVPGTAGTLDADGWIRYREHRLAGSFTGTGRKLAADGVRAAAASVAAQLEDGPDYPLNLVASLNGVSSGSFRADRAAVTAEGTLATHRAAATLVVSQAEARLAVSGGYRNGAWNGTVTDLSGHDAVGPWTLAAPAPLSVTPQRISLAPVVLNGAPGERAELAAEVVLPARTGSVHAGWSQINLARANAYLAGSHVTGASSGTVRARFLSGGQLEVTARSSSRGVLESQGHRVELTSADLTLDGGAAGMRATADVRLLGGETYLLFSSSDPLRLAIPRSGDFSGKWQGFDLAVLAPFLPQGVAAEGILVGELRGELRPGGMVTVSGNSFLHGGRIRYAKEPDQFDLPLDQAQLFFGWRGALNRMRDGRLVATLRVGGRGTYLSEGRRLEIERVLVNLDAGDQGVHGRAELALPGGGTLQAAVDAQGRAALALPETAELSARWEGIDPVLFRPWLPGGMNLQGKFSGVAQGRFLPGQRLDLAGNALFAEGRAQLKGPTGELSAQLRQATLTWRWRDQNLVGDFSLNLAASGSGQGSFDLPIPARLPVAVDPRGTVRGRFVAQVREKGLLTSVFPDLVQESHGNLDADLTVAGIWGDPRFSGYLKLADAGAYIPAAGIQVSDVQLSAHLEQDVIRIDSFAAKSGKGRLTGEATIRFGGNQRVGYQGTLKGERFQTVFLPELQLYTSPQLTFQGDLKSLSVRGEVVVPEMLVAGPPGRSAIGPSRDVVLEGAPPAERQAAKLALDVKVRVTLGDKVLVKAYGIDAKLGGGIDLEMASLDRITSRGEVRVVKGSYRAYGIDLEIVRGRIYYAGGAITEPTLDIRALRTVGDVKAGVTVEGLARAPIIRLYSEPSLPDVDVLAYMVLGHPLGSASGEQVSVLSQAAGSLLSLGRSDSLQEEIKERLGLSVLGFEQRNETTTGLMGYKEIAVTPTGAPAKTATMESMLTVGKYITPRLYFSYGRSVVTGNSLFQLRYDIFRHWQIETQTGTESGADLYYKIEFD